MESLKIKEDDDNGEKKLLAFHGVKRNPQASKGKKKEILDREDAPQCNLANTKRD